jgi:AcrR family transcriptional regulator
VHAPHVAREAGQAQPSRRHHLHLVTGGRGLRCDLAGGQAGAVGEQETQAFATVCIRHISTAYICLLVVPRQARISRERVLQATLEIAEEQGLAAVSMRAVARRVGVTPMALYHHVRDKEDLLDALVERLLTELLVPNPELPWQERLRVLGASLRETAGCHPDAFLMLLRRPATTPGARRARDAIYSALADAGVPRDEIPRVERLISTFMIGFAASEAAGRFAAHGRSVLDADLEWAQAQVLGLLPSAGRAGGTAARKRAPGRG